MKTLSLALSLIAVRAFAAEPARLSLQLGHSEPVSAVSLSEDGRYLMTFGEDRYNVLWDAETGVELRRYGGNPCFPNAGLLLKSKDLFITAGRSCAGHIAVYQLSTGKQLAFIPAHNGNVKSLILSPDGKLLASTGDDGKVRLWSVGTWAPVRTFEREGPTLRATFSKDGSLLAAVGGDGNDRHDRSIRVWEVKSGKERARLESKVVVGDALFLPDGRLVTAAEMGMYAGPGGRMLFDGGVLIWNLDAKEPAARSQQKYLKFSRLAALPNGRFLTTSAQGLVVNAAGESAFVTSGAHAIAEWDPADVSTSTYALKDPRIVDWVGIEIERNEIGRAHV